MPLMICRHMKLYSVASEPLPVCHGAPSESVVRPMIFFDRMQEIDRVVAAALNDAHAREAASVNARRRSRPPMKWVTGYGIFAPGR